MNYYYIHQGRVLVYAQDISEAMDMSEDYNEQQKCHVTMTPEQIAFYEANKTATVKEVWNCALLQPVIVPPSEIRAQLYEHDKRISWGGTMITCDMALRIIISLKMRDKLTDAAELEVLWLATFNEIKVENPD